MPAYPVIQPDGKYAIWSTVVDHFLEMNLSAAQCKAALSFRYPQMPDDKLVDVINNVAVGTDDFDRWDKCLAWAIYRHGENDADVVWAMQITPDITMVRVMDILADIRREGENDYRQARGVLQLDEPSEEAIRRLRGPIKAIGDEDYGVGNEPTCANKHD